MFQSLVTFATLLATGAHGLFGCCWHHEHAHHHAGCQVEQSSEVEVHSHQCACRNAHPHDDGEGRDDSPDVAFAESPPCGHSDEHGSGECCEGRCQFLTNAKVELPALDGPNGDSTLAPRNWNSAAYAQGHRGLPIETLAASMLTGSLSVRDLTQIARI